MAGWDGEVCSWDDSVWCESFSDINDSDDIKIWWWGVGMASLVMSSFIWGLFFLDVVKDAHSKD